MARTLSLDLGDKRIGVAMSDPTGLLASPVTTIIRGNLRKDLDKIVEMVTDNEVEAIVVGLPVSLNGTIGPQGQKTLDFCDLLREISPVPIHMCNEQYTSAEAERRIREAGGEPSKDKARVDAVAAAIILQEWLDEARPPVPYDETPFA
jgi:putative Holliday junction resolvase